MKLKCIVALGALVAIGNVVYADAPEAVSYTHLTLPTNREV